MVVEKPLPVLLLPKLIGATHATVVVFGRHAQHSGNGYGEGTSVSEFIEDLHHFGRDQKIGDGIGEGEHSYDGTNTLLYRENGSGYAFRK